MNGRKICGIKGLTRLGRFLVGPLIESLIGRGDKIRTCDPLHPMQVRYQAAPRPDRNRMIAQLGNKGL